MMFYYVMILKRRPSWIFADDMKMYRVLRDAKEDVKELQKDLTRLESWSNDWQLQFNTDE